MATYKAWAIADPSGPGPDIIAITPNDDADISNTLGPHTVVGVRAIRSANAGSVRVTMASGEVRDLAFTAGETRTGQFQRVWATGTTVVIETAGAGLEGHL